MKTIDSTKTWIALVAATMLLFVSQLRADENRKPDPAKERALLVTLQSGSPAEKAIACKQLAIHGSRSAVPELAKLLADEQLASWARIALEPIPDSSADKALRTQLDKLNGDLLIGVINSIGVRRDAAAVEGLSSILKGQDADVASAAAAALGSIGDSTATRVLRQSLAGSSAKVRPAVAEGCILCAERLMNAGKLNEAAALYDEIRQADVPKQRILEATRGAILARKADGIPLLIEQLESSDKARFQIALSTARELQGPQIAETLAAHLAKTKADRAVLLLSVLADRDDSTVSPAILAAAKSGDKLVRVAAIGAIGRIGSESSLPTLLEIAADRDEELAEAAKQSIAALQGDQIDSEIIKRLANAEGESLLILIALAGQRRIDATELLTEALDHSDAAVRHAALAALGETIGPNSFSILITRTLNPKEAADAQAALAALKAASVRMPDRERCAAELAAAISKVPIATQAEVMEILAAVGGQKALAIIGDLAKRNEVSLADTATRVLGEWMNTDAAPVLLDLAKNEPSGKYRVRSLRGYIRLARQFATSEPQRAEMCQHALDAATRLEEQKLVLDILRRHPNVDSLRVAIKAMETPALHDEAARIAMSIAQKLGVKSDEVQELIAKTMYDAVELEIIKAEYGAGDKQKDVTRMLQKHAGKARWMILPSANYNQSFGGDPAPNVVKKLRIQYRINGKPGEASFSENSLIVLPMP